MMKMAMNVIWCKPKHEPKPMDKPKKSIKAQSTDRVLHQPNGKFAKGHKKHSLPAD